MRYRLGADPGGVWTNAPNVIGGSSANSALTTVVGATIAGGGGNFSGDGTLYANKVTGNFGTVGGGFKNTSSGFYATVAGGELNTASSEDATVAGGNGNTANGQGATVAGGLGNTASGQVATVAGGLGNTASGFYATVPGGSQNTAGGDYSFAAGYGAHAQNNGSFVWADGSFSTFSSTTANQFRVRATGGAAFVTAIDSSGAATAGVRVQSGDTSWSAISDRNAKKNFQPVNGEAVLDKLAAVPVQSWNYKWEADDTVPHLGPMAQDFKAAFYPGRDDKCISTLEFDGVELAAIQGLNQKLKQKETEITELKQKNSSLERRLDELEKLIRK